MPYCTNSVLVGFWSAISADSNTQISNLLNVSFLKWALFIPSYRSDIQNLFACMTY